MIRQRNNLLRTRPQHLHARFGRQWGRSIFSLVLWAGQASRRTSVEFVSENKRQWWKRCLYLFLHHTCNTASQATRFDLLVFYIKLPPFEVKAFELGKNCCSCCLTKLPSFRVSVAVDRVVSIDCCRSYYPQTYRVSFRFFFLYFYFEDLSCFCASNGSITYITRFQHGESGHSLLYCYLSSQFES